MFDPHEFERSLSKSPIVEVNPRSFYQMVEVVNDAAKSHFSRDIDGVIDQISALTEPSGTS